MGIVNREGALYMATGIDNTGLYKGRQEAVGIIKAMTSEITSLDVFGGIGISAGVAFASAAKDAYVFEKQFESSMKEVSTISDLVKESMEATKNKIISLTTDDRIPVGANDMAKALYQIVSAGHDGANGMHILEIAGKSAVGGLTETATAADAITTILNAYKKDASEAESVSDMLFTTARLGKTTFGEMGKSISQVAPIAASFGIEMDQVLAAVATLTKSGVPTAQAMTQIRAAIIGVSKELGDGAFNTMTFQEALQQIADKANGSESALRAMMPEIEGFNGLLGLTGINAKAAANDLGAMNKSAGSTEKAFKEMGESAENQLKLLGNNITAFLRPFGKGILKEVSRVSGSINKAFESGDAHAALQRLGDLVVIVTGAFVGYKGSILAVSAAKKANLIITQLLTSARSAEQTRLIVSKGLHYTEAGAIAKNTSARILLTNAIKAQISAQLKGLAAMATNPYILAAAAVAALGYGLYKLATMENMAEKAARHHREEQDKFKKAIDDRRQHTEELLHILQDESETELKKIEAYKKLQSLSPALTTAYNKETLAVLDLAEANKILNAERDKFISTDIQAHIKQLQDEIKMLNGKRNFGGNKGAFSQWILGREIDSKQEKLNIYVKDLERAKQAEKEARTTEEKLLEAKADLPGIQEEFEKARKKIEEERAKLEDNPLYVIPFNVEIDEKKAEKKLKDLKDKINGLSGGSESGSTNNRVKDKSYWEKLKKDAEDALSRMDVSESGSKGWNRLTADIAKYQAQIDKFDTSKRSKESFEVQKETEKYKSLIKQQSLEQIRVFEDLQMQADEARIAATKEGSEKVIKQMELNFEKEMQAIDRKKEDLLRKKIDDARAAFEADPKNKKRVFSGSGISLSGDESKMFDNMYKSAIEKNDKSYMELTNQYQSYTDERISIEKKFNEDIAVLQEARRRAQGNGLSADVEKINRSISQATADKGKALMGLDYEQLKKSPEYIRAFENLRETSSSTLNSLLSQFEEAKHAAAEVLSPDQLREYTTTIQEIMDELDSRNPFQALTDRKRELAEAEQELAEAKRNLDSVRSGKLVVSGSKHNTRTGAVENTYLSGSEALNKYNKAQDKVAKASSRVKSAEKKTKDVIDKLAESIRGVGDALGGQAGEILNLVADIGQFAVMAMNAINFTAKGASAAIRAVETASIILAVIGAALQIAMKIYSLFAGQDQKQYEQMKANYENLVAVWDQLIDRKKEYISVSTGAEADRAGREALEVLRKQIEATKQLALAQLKVKGGSHSMEYRMWEGSYKFDGKNWKDIAGDISRHTGRIFNSMRDLTNMTADELMWIQENYSGFWANLNGEFKSHLETLISFKDKEKEIVEITNETLTQTSFSSMYDNFIEQLMDMKTSTEDFVDDINEQFMRAFLANEIGAKYREKLKKWYEAFAGDLKDGKLSEEEVLSRREEYKRFVEEAIRDRDNISKITGYTGDKKERGTSGKLQESLTEGTANQFVGLSNMIALDVRYLKELAPNHFKLCEEMRLDVERIMLIAEEIKNNTGRTADNTEGLKEELRGIKNEISEVKKNTKEYTGRG